MKRINIIDILTVVITSIFILILSLSLYKEKEITGKPVIVNVKVTQNAGEIKSLAKETKSVYFNSINAPVEVVSTKDEVLLIKNVKDELWEAWLRPGRKAKTGDLFIFNEKTASHISKKGK